MITVKTSGGQPSVRVLNRSEVTIGYIIFDENLNEYKVTFIDDAVIQATKVVFFSFKSFYFLIQKIGKLLVEHFGKVSFDYTNADDMKLPKKYKYEKFPETDIASVNLQDLLGDDYQNYFKPKNNNDDE